MIGLEIRIDKALSLGNKINARSYKFHLYRMDGYQQCCYGGGEPHIRPNF
jgi:hypothetical protein